MFTLLIRGAVPFGFTDSMADSNFVFSDEGVIYDNSNWLQNTTNGTGLAPLPDVIPNTTASPSPTSRARPSLHEKPQAQRPPQPTPHPPLNLIQPTTMSSTSVEGGRRAHVPDAPSAQGSGEGSVKMEVLEQSQEVEEVVPCLPHTGTQFYPPCWTLRHHSRNVCDSGETGTRKEAHRGRGRDDSDTEKEEETLHQLWWRTGTQLRKIADQFQLNNAKVGKKRTSEQQVQVSVRVTLTRCVSASLLLFVCWRLFK